MYRTRNDLPIDVRERIIAVLDTRLADLIDLRTQAKVAHWNVKGPSFAALHQLFEDVAESVDHYADVVAERAVQLGGIARGTARQVAATSELDEYSATGGTEEHVAALADALAAVASSARHLIDETANAGDQVTADLVTEVSRGIDKWLWMVEAHLQEGQVSRQEEDVSRAQATNESALSPS